MLKRFDSKRVYNEKYLKTKINSYNGKINTNDDCKGFPKELWHCTCLSVILIGSGLKFESQYIVKENRMTKFINNGLEVSSDESDEEVSDQK